MPTWRGSRVSDVREGAAPAISFVHEWLTDWGGSEDTLAQMLRCYPGSPLHATIDYLSDADRLRLDAGSIRTTFLQRAPWIATKFWNYLPVTGLAVETHDVGAADVVVSSSHAFANGARARSDQLHLGYIYSPMRYAWDLQDQYLADYGLDRGMKGLAARYMFQRLRAWDRHTAGGVDGFAAISRFIQQRIWRAWRRPSVVIYPPVSLHRFDVQATKEDYYVTVSRLVSYKRVDLIVDAFARMPQRRLVVIGGGPELEKLRSRCPPNVELLGRQPDDVVQQHLRAAKAFVFAALEDFGISPVEAQACGTPVIAYGRGGSAETVRDLRTLPQPTGLHFHEQTAASLVAAVEAFEQGATIDPADCRAWAETFDEAHFRARFMRFVDAGWSAWRQDPASTERAIQAALA